MHKKLGAVLSQQAVQSGCAATAGSAASHTLYFTGSHIPREALELLHNICLLQLESLFPAHQLWAQELEGDDGQCEFSTRRVFSKASGAGGGLLGLT
jgi:hypothetical protein